MKKNKEFKKGDIVRVVNTETVPSTFLGRYGLVVEVHPGYKVSVEFNARVGSKDSMTHTAAPVDLELVSSIVPPGEGNKKGPVTNWEVGDHIELIAKIHGYKVRVHDLRALCGHINLEVYETFDRGYDFMKFLLKEFDEMLYGQGPLLVSYNSGLWERLKFKLGWV